MNAMEKVTLWKTLIYVMDKKRFNLLTGALTEKIVNWTSVLRIKPKRSDCDITMVESCHELVQS